MKIDELRKLDHAATGVKWKWYPPNDADEIIIEFAGKSGEQDWGGLRVCPNGGTQRQCEADTKLVAAARNALGPLLKVAEAAKQLVDVAFIGRPDRVCEIATDVAKALAELERA